MSDSDRRSRMASMRRRQRHIAEARSLGFRTLQSENARLRAALEDIVRMLGPDDEAAESGGLASGGGEVLSIARKALDEHP